MRWHYLVVLFGCAACDAAPELEPGLWTLSSNYRAGQGEQVATCYVDGSGAMDVVWYDPVTEGLFETCLGMIDATGVATLTDLMNELDILTRESTLSDGEDIPHGTYRVRATGGDAAGQENSFRDEIQALYYLDLALQTLARSQLTCTVYP